MQICFDYVEVPRKRKATAVAEREIWGKLSTSVAYLKVISMSLRHIKIRAPHSTSADEFPWQGRSAFRLERWILFGRRVNFDQMQERQQLIQKLALCKYGRRRSPSGGPPGSRIAQKSVLKWKQKRARPANLSLFGFALEAVPEWEKQKKSWSMRPEKCLMHFINWSDFAPAKKRAARSQIAFFMINWSHVQ